MKTKPLAELFNHSLATAELRDLLVCTGKPKTQQEKNIMACLASAYTKMGEQFPSPQLCAELNALYSQATSFGNEAIFAISDLVTQHIKLTLEGMGLTPQSLTIQTQEQFEMAWSKAYRDFDGEVITPVRLRCLDLCYLTLQAATKRINAVLNKAKKK